MRREMVAAVVIRGGRMLFVKNIKKGVRLEPPGGKVEPDESIEEAVIRECGEELGVHMTPLMDIGNYPTESPEGGFDVHMILCEMEGEPAADREPEKIGGFEWLTLAQLKDLIRRNEKGDLSVLVVPNVVAALDDLAKYLEIA